MASLSGGPDSPDSFNDSTNSGPSMPSLTVPSFADDDSEEWEYEYSTTDTEFYYLTLDLPVNLSELGMDQAPRKGRGGYRSVWINRGGGRPKRELEKAPRITVGGTQSNLPPTPARAASVEEDDPEDDSDMEEEDDELVQKAAKESPDIEMQEATGAIRNAKEIQILELHSDNPIISFMGQSFSCSWAENIGTELLFMKHDSTASLPVLRSLSDGVDLLAASSARIVSKLATFAPKPYERNIDLDDDDRDENSLYELERTASIPLNKRVSDERKAQANFLERVMDIKQQKGETDAVTVFTRARMAAGTWQTLVNERRVKERSTLDSQLQEGGEVAAAAAQRLAEMKREDEEDVERERNSMIGRKRRAKKSVDEEDRGPRKRARRGERDASRPAMVVRRPRNNLDKMALRGIHKPPRALAPKTTIEPPGEGSTSTAQNWDDLGPEDSTGELYEDGNIDGSSDEDFDD